MAKLSGKLNGSPFAGVENCAGIAIGVKNEKGALDYLLIATKVDRIKI